jgi:hypothetical protein
MALTQGTFSYNGHTFDHRTQTLGIDIRPISDAAGRTVARNAYSLKVKSWVYPSDNSASTQSDDLEAIRRRLTSYGGELRYQDKGFGDLTINVAGGQRDVVWGPKPSLLSWKPIGGNLAAEIIWQVEFHTMDCTNAVYRFWPMEFNYRVALTYDRSRLEHRRISGYLTIPQTRATQSSRRLTDSADNYYALLVPPVPVGFRREDESREIDESKCRLDFSFSDVQLLMPLPPGVEDCTIEHSQQNTKPHVMTQISGSLSASYKMHLDWPLEQSYVYFKDLVNDRLKAIQNAVVRQPQKGDPGKLGKLVIPHTLAVRESPMTRTMNYSLSYMTLAPVNDFLLAGFYRQLPGHDHNKWALSMARANRPGAYTQTQIREQDDAIVDLCLPSIQNLYPLSRGIPGTIGSGSRFSLSIPCPDPARSWLWYQIWILVETDDNTVGHKPLPQKPAPAKRKPGRPSLADVFEEKRPWEIGQSDPHAKAGETTTLAQRRASETHYVTIVGVAIRICYDIPVPSLDSVGGSPVELANREGIEHYLTGVVGSAGGHPVIAAKWRRRYLLTKRPREGAETPDNPLIGGAGTGIGSGIASTFLK